METTVVASTGLSRKALLRRALLACGIVSSLLYVGADILAATQYEGYRFTDQHISELLAIGAPTRSLMVILGTIYNALVLSFGVGVWASAGGNRALRLTGATLLAYGLASLAGPFVPMNARGTEGVAGDSVHLVATGACALFLALSIGLGGAARGKRFRLYSILTVAVVLLAGAWAGSDASQIAAGLPTPGSGVKERICIYAAMLWVLVFAVTLLRAEEGRRSVEGNGARRVPSSEVSLAQ